MWNEFRFALRTLRRSRGVAGVAVLSLALGIGANMAISSLIYQVAVRGLPVANPERLVALESDPYNFAWTRADNHASAFSKPMYEALRDHNQSLSGLIARMSFLPRWSTTGRLPASRPRWFQAISSVCWACGRRSGGSSCRQTTGTGRSR